MGYAMNLNHLKYFYEVAMRGGVTRASESLHVTPQTISAQLRLLEDSLGYELFEREGNKLIVNQEGKIVLDYAEEIFRMERELLSQIGSGEPQGRVSVSIGILDSIPKIWSSRAINKIYEQLDDVKVKTHETDFEQLLADLSLNKLDLILSDRPIPPNVSIRASNTLLLQSGFTFFAQAKYARKLSHQFPFSLDGQPMLLPGERSAQFSHILSWFDKLNIKPRVLGEFDDTELMKILGEQGHGVFCAPSIIAEPLQAQFKVREVGRTEEIRENYYAITSHRKIRNKAVEVILQSPWWV